MRRSFFLKYIVFALILSLLMVFVTSIQAKSCSLYLGFFDDAGSNDIQDGIVSTVYKLNAKNKIINARLGEMAMETMHKSTIPYADDPKMEKIFPILAFDNLREGKYRITTKKSDYRTSSITFSHSCSLIKGKRLWILLSKDVSEHSWSLLDRGTYDVNDLPVDLVPGGNIPQLKASPQLQECKGDLTNNALYFARPIYPKVAKAVRASGKVTVYVAIDSSGKVTSATAINGHPLLKKASEDAAYKARFLMKMFSNSSNCKGYLVYTFKL